MKRLMILAATLFIATASTRAAEYISDPAQSKLTFQAYSLFGKANGEFHEFSVKADVDESALEKSTFTVTINIETIDTGTKGRDKHLRNQDFFDTAKFPTSTYRTLSIEKTSAQTFYMRGELTMHGVTQSVGIPVAVTKFEAGELAAVGDISINRKDFGINYDSRLNPIKDEVKISFSVLLKKKTP